MDVLRSIYNLDYPEFTGGKNHFDLLFLLYVHRTHTGQCHYHKNP